MMSITLLNVSWKAEELLFIALLLVQNLFCLPSLSLKTGLGLGFVFPFFVFYPVLEFVHGMCWWRIFCVSIWLLGTCLFWVTPWAVRPPFPVLPQPCASGVTRQGLCLLPPIDSYELVGEGCLCSTKSVLVSNMRNRVCLSQENWCTGMWILLLSPGHFVWLYQARRNCNSDLTSKICLRGCIFHRSKIPTCSLLMFLEISGFS